jgi:RNA 3'-terminal phosphate cyclase
MRSSTFARGAVVVGLALASATWAHAQQPKAKTATQFYLEYRAAFDKATKIDDLMPYMAAENRKQVEATPKDDQAKMFGMLKMMGALTQVKVLKEEHAPDGGAVLTVEALGPDKEKTTGKVTIVKEDGAMKVGREEWHSSSS